MEKSFNHKIVEDQRNEKWKKAKFFMTHDEAKRPFTIILPPPNVTGKLHIGHALDTYIQDTIIRYKKLQGYDVMWVPGKDHAGIATQAVVEKKLAERGISKYDLGREKFIEEVWKWKEEFSNNITSQWDKLGLALDFENERFTFDTEANEAVLKVFVDLYNAGLIYRDNKPINWDPKLQTALSNIEVVSRETNQKIYYIKYPIKDSDQHLVIATTRIETLFSDVAVAINPKDERIKELKNKTIIHPLTKKELPVVLSETIDPTFGSGVMKVSAHAIDDIEIIKKNNLEIIECIDKNGILNEQAMEFKGLDRLSARESIYIKLENEGYIDKVEQTKSAVGYSERSGEAIEILVQPQWFVKMNFLSQKLLKHFESVDGVKFIPERFAKDLTRWMTDTYDWTISRQIWWGHRIPAWYKDDEVKVQIENPGEGWVQDNDVLDTWFSSALSPFVFLGWPQTDIKIKRYFPTDVLVTAYDIIFFWVARMYFQSLYFMNEKPFKEVLIHGIVRDAEGRKMSKSLGNGIDPIQVIDEQGSDVLRMSLIFNCAPGQDINFSDDKIQTARLFINKFWNIARYISSLPIDTKDEINFKKLDYYDLWILAKFQLFKQSISNCMDKYEFNLIFKYVQDFIVNDLSSWYLEFIKFKNNNKLVHWLFREILILMHPFMPFVTDYLFEYIFHEELLEASSLQFEVVDEEVANKIQSIINIITTLRKYREEKHISKAEKLYFTYKNIDLTQTDIDIIKKLTNYEIQDNNDFMIQLPNDISINIKMSDEQKEQEIKDLLKLIAETKKEIEFNKKMLDNQSFISKAPKATISEKQQKLAMHTSNLEAYEKELAIKQNRK
ncbi:valine--tRNA ligase [Metamycoplasma cloacale]|uniref:Valine--tRNA ligase n=2 Tax=Metamycoplasma cloacale TaxID=92401 RepID=A0A2Z4LMF4_9BACT|nr:valine--tRNA ligase [Metamycoplasma cloacale]